MSEETIRELCLWAAGAIAALWGGSKVPWKAALAKLWPRTTSTNWHLELETAADVEHEMHAAIYTLRANIHDQAGQKLLDAVDSYLWQKRTEPGTPK